MNADEVLRHAGLNHNKTFFKMSFADNGIGFNQDHATQIFDIFQRLNAKSEYHGTGIGFPMSEKYARTMGEIYMPNQHLGKAPHSTLSFRRVNTSIFRQVPTRKSQDKYQSRLYHQYKYGVNCTMFFILTSKVG